MKDKDIIRMNQAQERSWYWYGKKKMFSHFIRKYTSKPGLKILDVGCGSGGLLNFLSQYGQVFGLDSSSKAVALCKRLGYSGVKCCSAEKISYPTGTFDLIVLSDIIEHVPNDKKVMSEVKRVLKKGGIALITVPAHQRLWSKNDEELHHKRRYSRNQLKSLQDDFKLKKLTYIHFLHYFPVRLFQGLRGSRLEWEMSGEGRTFKGKLLGIFLKIYSVIESSLIKYFNFPTGVGLLMVLKK